MDRYGIALGKKPKKIKLKKRLKNKKPKDSKRAYFTNATAMLEYMTEIGGTWIPEGELYFEEIPLLGFKNTVKTDEIVIITEGDYQKTKKHLSKFIRNRIDKEEVLYLVKGVNFIG